MCRKIGEINASVSVTYPVPAQMTLGNMRRRASMNSYSPLSTQAVALSSGGVIPNRTSIAATVKANSTIATSTKPALTTGHVPCGRDSIVLLICMSRSKPEIKRPTVFVCRGRPAICDLEHRFKFWSQVRRYADCTVVYKRLLGLPIFATVPVA